MRASKTKVLITLLVACVVIGVAAASASKPAGPSEPASVSQAASASPPGRASQYAGGSLPTSASQPTRLGIVATVFPVSAIVRAIGGDLVSVSTVVPAGADPHNFEITPSIARAIDAARLIITIVPAFDGWAVPVEKTGHGPARLVLADAFADSLIKLGDSVNPHIWLDPIFAKEIGRVVSQELCRLDAANCPGYEAGARAFAASMDSLDAAVRVRLARAGVKDYVAVHPAWTYFARRYGLNERSVLERIPEQEPSAKWIARVLSGMKRNNVRLVVAEEFSNMALATMVAKESGARLVVLDPLGGENRPGRDTYVGLVDYNVALLEKAMEAPE